MGANLFAIGNLQQVSEAARFRPHEPLSQPVDFVSPFRVPHFHGDGHLHPDQPRSIRNSKANVVNFLEV
jgi:hypothetical protein